jgi:hypothetical protein
MARVSTSDSRIPCDGISAASGCPATYSMTMKSIPSAVSISWMVTMPG